jgi:hypothetical protein
VVPAGASEAVEEGEVSGKDIVSRILESHAAVLRQHGIDPASIPLEEMARNAAAILHAELQAEEAEKQPEESWSKTWRTG